MRISKQKETKMLVFKFLMMCTYIQKQNEADIHIIIYAVLLDIHYSQEYV